MPITIDLLPEVEARLRAVAAARGQDPNHYAAAVVADAINRDSAHGKPLEQVVEEARKRHGFPDTWATGSEGTITEADWAEVDSAHAER